MKRYFKLCMLFTVLLSASSVTLYADDVCPWQEWVMVVMESGMERPVIMQYCTSLEETEDGIGYLRISDYSYIHREGEERRYNPIKLQYGYRRADKKIYIYDFETKKETLAFDFNLSAGDRFTTYNGMEWVVESVKDTLVDMSFQGRGSDEWVSKRLLVVRTLDGKLEDRWLEDFGSFMNHFMIKSMENVILSQTLWMMYDDGEYISREINADPIFGHDSGLLDGTYDELDKEENWEYWEEHGREEVKNRLPECTYEQGDVVFTDFRYMWPHRAYSCFYRNGDDIYRILWYDMPPHIDGASSLKKDVAILKGVPAPASGKYTVHADGKSYETGIGSIGASPKTAEGLYDLQGRRLLTQPEKGVYIKDGRKVCAE